MYYILTYDIAKPKRLVKTLKTCRRYMNWISRSVFEGELTPQQMERLLKELKGIIKADEDTIVLFSIRNTQVCEVDVYGSKKREDRNFV